MNGTVHCLLLECRKHACPAGHFTWPPKDTDQVMEMVNGLNGALQLSTNKPISHEGNNFYKNVLKKEKMFEISEIYKH